MIERDSAGYYVARVPELRGCHTQTSSLDELHGRTLEAVAVCLEGDERPEEEPMEFVGIHRIIADT
ncbi:MAG: type II toxin-antitoxin system HicB family antitoxin [Chthoniobacteraceae bacterium]